MDSKLLAINDGLLINPDAIETVDVAPDGGVLVHFAGGNNRTLTDDDAAGFLRFLKPVTTQMPAAPKAAPEQESHETKGKGK